ncbi:MAG: sensor histidine kinase [Thermodesulfobacteriota bacterium]
MKRPGSGKGPQRLLVRIVVPFALLFAGAALIFWLLSSWLIVRSLHDDLRQQMTRVAGVISRASYVLNPHILAQMRDVVSAEIILFDGEGDILHCTIPGWQQAATAAAIREKGFVDAAAVPPVIEFAGSRYHAVIQPLTLPGHGQAFLCLWKKAGEAERLRSRILAATGWLALGGIVVLSLLGYFIVRTITRPLEELAHLTSRIATNDFRQRARARGRDEIALLADSFNTMLDRLQDYEQQLVQSERMATAGKMAAGLAHEVRNPLTSIKMFVQVLLNRLRDQPDNREMVAALLREIERLERIIDQLVERARPSEPARRPGAINEQLTEVLALAGPALEAAAVTLESRLAPDLPSLCYDGEKMKQVFWNLLINSREAMGKGGGIEVISQPGPGGVTITVADSGPGIPEEAIEECFASFYTTKPEGLGLGLSTSRDIVERHGGTLTLANRPGGGLVATIFLPADKEGA